MRGCRHHQPLDLTCQTCAGRYARRTARAILTTNPRQLHGVNFVTTLSPGEFRSWRVAARNLIDHQRRESRWWSGVQIQVWLGADGQVRGIAALDAITPEEFEEAFQRWGPTLRRIGPEELADEVYAAVRPGVIAEVDGGGYHSIRLTIGASGNTKRTTSATMTQARIILPMPILV